MLWTLIYQCTVNTISHKCTGDTKFGVRIVTNLGHQIWCPGDTKFFTVHYIKSKQQDHTGIGTLRINGTVTVISDTHCTISKPEMLNQDFKSVFSIEETKNVPIN